ncbi:hypothetical protein GCM10022403_019410 [Streptomyces coacervatus]|uniref:Uncharacterized protein n=1 Tax=Streptomyces coacervatus TaxID=647381 RepID=A0ABP7H5C9_9ACTN
MSISLEDSRAERGLSAEDSSNKPGVVIKSDRSEVGLTVEYCAAEVGFTAEDGRGEAYVTIEIYVTEVDLTEDRATVTRSHQLVHDACEERLAKCDTS